MLYYLFDYLDSLDVPGAGVFHYISFRAMMALMLSMLISIIWGKKLINFLHRLQIGETIRELGLEGQTEKKGTPTMGGILILISLLIPTLLFAKLGNVYVILMIITTVWLAVLGGIDDYIKVFKKNKEGLSGRIKIVGQIGIGLIVGLTLVFNEHVVSVQNQPGTELSQLKNMADKSMAVEFGEKSTITTIPFAKNHEFDYSSLLSFAGDKVKDNWGWLVFVLAVIFIVTAVSNGANITDGLDGLAASTSWIIGLTLGFFAYVSGNIIFADYLNIMYIPHIGELMIFASAFVGATAGFLWYNAYPAQVFMGDTGSLMLGGVIGVFAVLVRKELLIPVLCGIFLIENLSVMLQVSYFKYTKKRTGVGQRIFLMAPLHHHYQKKGLRETKIVARFMIIGAMLAVISVATLKLR